MLPRKENSKMQINVTNFNVTFVYLFFVFFNTQNSLARGC